MKNLLHVFLFLVIMACKNEKPALPAPERKTMTRPAALKGEWISIDYVQQLNATKSTRTAQPACVLCGFIFDPLDTTKVSANWNFHEGGDLKLVRTAKGWQMTMPETDIKFDLEFTSTGTIRAGEKEYRQMPVTEALYALYAGKYESNGQAVELKADGRVTGLGKFSHFEAIPDYITDMGKGDRIRLYEGDPDTGPGQLFGVAITDNQLVIYKLKCLEKDESGCISEDLGKVAFSLVKEN